jgi:serine/threonine protein kinase
MQNNNIDNTKKLKNQDTEKPKFDHIANRIEFIHSLLDGKKLEPLIDVVVSKETNNSDNSIEGGDTKQHKKDIREILNKKAYDFNQIITEIGGKLQYVKSGTTGHTFKGISYNQANNKTINYGVKIVAYSKKDSYGDLNRTDRPENAELMMLKLLSEFVLIGQTPHIVLPIGSFNTNISPFVKLARTFSESKKFEAFLEKYEKNEYYDEVSVLISEWANGGDLLDYIKENYKTMKIKEWRVIFFQILSVLAVIQKKYPAFRHNDLKPNNILVQVSEVNNNNKALKFRYVINGHEYYVPNIGAQIKLWDFDFACIPGIIENSKVDADWTDRINIKPEQNRYYDVHYFFNTFTRKGFFNEFWTLDEIPKEVKDFVRRVVPLKYSEGKNVSERGRILHNKEFVRPDILLEHDVFFEKMRPKK